MKTFCVLISLVIVNVLADLEGYMNAVAITTRHMQVAHDSTDEKGLGIVIYKMIEEESYNMEHLNYMITVPDLANHNVEEQFNLQSKMRDEIYRKIKVRTPDARIQADANRNLDILGQSRRVIAGKALKKQIIKILYAEDRTTARYCDRANRNRKICRLIALWMSTTTSSLTNAREEMDCICHITYIDRNGVNHIRQYRGGHHIYEEVDVNNFHNVLGNLERQL